MAIRLTHLSPFTILIIRSRKLQHFHVFLRAFRFIAKIEIDFTKLRKREIKSLQSDFSMFSNFVVLRRYFLICYSQTCNSWNTHSIDSIFFSFTISVIPSALYLKQMIIQNSQCCFQNTVNHPYGIIKSSFVISRYTSKVTLFDIFTTYQQ